MIQCEVFVTITITLTFAGVRIKLVVWWTFSFAVTTALVWIKLMIRRAALYATHAFTFLLIKLIRIIAINVIGAFLRRIRFNCL